MAKIDMLSKSWNDLLFEGRNKSYGAYEMRADTGKRNLKAMLGLLILLAAAFILPFMVSAIQHAAASLGNDQAMELRNVQDEPEEEEVVVEQHEEEQAPAETVTEMASSIQFTVPEITDNVAEDKELIAQQKAQEAKAKMGEFNFQGNDETSTNIKSDQKQLGAVNSKGGGEGEGGKVFTYVEQMPVFPGGEAALNKFIQTHLKYPAVSLEEGVQGKVLLRFVVNENGSVGDVQILKSLDTYCDREAKRVVQMLPRFTPGRQQGKPVKVWFQLPITFAID